MQWRAVFEGNFHLWLMIALLLTGLRLPAQNLDQSLAFGRASFERGEYTQAIKVLERVYFFGKGDYRSGTALLLAEAYYQLGQWEESFAYYDLGFHLLQDDSLRIECLYGKVRSRIAQGRLAEALDAMKGFPGSSEYLLDSRKEFYLGAIYFALEDYPAAETHFLAALSSPDDSIRVQEIFEKNKKLKRIHPQLAKGMSMVFPGSGQMYAGDFKNGINSLLLTGALAGAGIYMGLRYGILDAVVTVFPWFFRYYRGGYLRAARSARDRIQRKRAELYRELMEFFEKE